MSKSHVDLEVDDEVANASATMMTLLESERFTPAEAGQDSDLHAAAIVESTGPALALVIDKSAQSGDSVVGNGDVMSGGYSHAGMHISKSLPPQPKLPESTAVLGYS